MDPSPLHSPKTGVDFWKPLSDGFTMGKKKGDGGAEGGEERGLFCKRIKTQINFSLDRQFSEYPVFSGYNVYSHTVNCCL